MKFKFCNIAPIIGILLNGLFFPNTKPLPFFWLAFFLHLDQLHMEYNYKMEEEFLVNLFEELIYLCFYVF